MNRILTAIIALTMLSEAAYADRLFWVVGSRKKGGCDIVTSNPVIDPDVWGDIWFGDGPYRSRRDAKKAIETIAACPPYVDPEDQKKT